MSNAMGGQSLCNIMGQFMAVTKKADGKNHDMPVPSGCILPSMLRCNHIEWHQDGYCHNSHDDQ